MSKHTPGPWVPHEWRVFAAGEHGNLICDCAEDRDARLIAAAPTLVAALEGLMDAVPTQTNDRDWWPDELTRAMAAARKALDEAGIEP